MRKETLIALLQEVKEDMTLDYIARTIVEAYDPTEAEELADLIIKHI